jgi:hypothetical protein
LSWSSNAELETEMESLLAIVERENNRA